MIRHRASADRVWTAPVGPLLIDVFITAHVPEWYARGVCAQTDPEAFYPQLGGSTVPAKKVCAICPVESQCREYALANGEPHGVWGGTSEQDRRRILRERRTAS